ncbi:DUF2207 domain-containing protein [Clostridium sp. E02]|uniref:DUF2207 domain-containing protein n=1 Tax=Clostridium sp. E02 TaxID=2487134 RepID=UPI000F535BC7|nr:DUF2207 domain-containing protein [Clostridium sp. E02]
MELKQKHLFPIWFLLAILFILNAVPVFAAEDAIPSIRVEVNLQSDGSAAITEIWDVRGVTSGTEYYKALNNLNEMSVHSLIVSDESGQQYKTLDNWDTKRSKDEKSGTCGILKTSKGYELCWGIGSYGDHQYTIQYTLEGLVKDYGDYAGFYHQFLSELSSAPGSAYIRIRMPDVPLTADNARIWGYGFTGEVTIENDGSLTAISTKALKNNDYANVLCRFDRSLFPKASAGSISFEKLQESADNKNSNTVMYIIFAVSAVAIVGSIILLIFFYSRFKLADGTIVRLPGMKHIDKNWAIPFGGSIPSVYSTILLLRNGIPYDALMGAYLIRWQEAGYIHIEMRDHDQNGKKSKNEEAILFSPDKPAGPGVEYSLYLILTGFADESGILWVSDMKDQAEKISEKLTAWAERVKLDGNNELIRINAAATDIKGSIRFTASGFEQAIRTLGFQKYLKDMRSQDTDQASNEALWGDYLVFATLFQIGEQVLDRMKSLDPKQFNSFSGMYGCSPLSMIYLMTMTNHVTSAAAPKSNIAGTGGGVSSSGGGGFSGGGGGGSR